MGFSCLGKNIPNPQFTSRTISVACGQRLSSVLSSVHKAGRSPLWHCLLGAAHTDRAFTIGPGTLDMISRDIPCPSGHPLLTQAEILSHPSPKAMCKLSLYDPIRNKWVTVSPNYQDRPSLYVHSTNTILGMSRNGVKLGYVALSFWARVSVLVSQLRALPAFCGGLWAAYCVCHGTLHFNE